MIISNTWLQTDYGIKFGNFLLDHFKINAVIDITLRLFKDALITTCILLAERETDKTRRLENNVAFIRIPGEVESMDDVEELRKAVDTYKSDKYTVIVVKQKDIPRDEKWITMFSEATHILRHITSHPLTVKLGELFEPSRGNTKYTYMASTGKISGTKDPGSSEFYYLSPSKVKGFELDKFAYPNASLNEALIYPAITNAKHVNYFTFTKEDWEKICASDDECYMFIGHKPRQDLPKEVEEYVRRGETEIRAKAKEKQMGGRGRLACETEAAKARTRYSQYFYGWYDLGGVIPVRIFAVYYGHRKTRFVYTNFPVAMCHNFIALIPKEKVSLDEIHIKALLAYLNSSFTQLYIETKGRKSPGGVIGLEVSITREMLVLDVRKLSAEQLGLLAKLFDELESETRRIGGASARDQLEKLKPKIYEIDRTIAAILGIKEEDVKVVQREVDSMVERRVSAAKRSHV